MTTRPRHLRPLLLGLLAAAGCALLLAAAPVLAQQPQGSLTGEELLSTEVGTTIGTGTGDIRITIARVIRVALGLLGTIALLLILYAGFLWMTAAGDDEKIARAKKTLTAAVIGLVIILSAFGIVSFILNALVTATTGGPGGGGGGGGGGGFGSAGGAFRPTAIQPSGTLAKRDVVTAVTFSSAPTQDIANIRANILLERTAGGSRVAVDYEPVVQNNTIKLVPVQPCPDPNADRRCLEADSDFVVTVKSGLKNANASDPRTVNCGINAICSQTFHTGSEVATEPPTVRISNPSNGQSLPAGDLVQVQSLLTDPNGVANVDYFAEGAFFAADGNAENIAPSTYRSQVAWDTAAFTPVKSVALKARVTNIDGDEVESDEIRVMLRPAHCFNTIKDADETGPDCGGPDCGACTGASCTDDSECASGQCVDGQCVEEPRINDVQLPDGKPGNLVTIFGQHFGAAPGKVTFLGLAEDDAKDAALGDCVDAWSSGRIVVIVPEGAVSGPIRVTTSGGKTDATNDLNGPTIDNFTVNDIARPGICSVDPLSAKVGRTLTVTGQGFGAVQGASKVQLARAAVDCSQVQPWPGSDSTNVTPWTDTSLVATVPNVETGASGLLYLVRTFVDGQSSNFACIRVEPPEAGTEPRIDFLSPEAGSVGTYVTLFGDNFGGGGTVRFRSSAGEAVGDVSFPEQCSTGYWRDSDVTVKVPAKFTTPADQAIALGAYDVTVVRSDGRTSNAKTFTINTDPLAPGVCRIAPDNGPAGTGVTLYGEGFEDVDAGDLDELLDQHPDSVFFTKDRNVSSLGLWQDTSISTAVPTGAVTGPVHVRSYSSAPARTSNGINFRVRDCRTGGADAACESGETCCNDGACRADCAEQTNVGGFAWQFSTGPIPVFPVVLEDATCQITDPTTMPSPNPFRGATNVCLDVAAVALRFSLPMDPATLIPSNLVFEACAGDVRAEAPCTPVVFDGPSVTTYDIDGRTLLSFGVSGLEPSKWHRLTIQDTVHSLGAPERASQPLDGDYDSRGGGDYVTTFKTGTEPCLLAAVDVQPADGLISDADQILPYKAFPLSDTCVILSCANRTVTWDSSDTTKAVITGAAAPNACDASARPVAETDPGPPIEITAVVDTKEDQGDLTVDYANPRVVKYGPADCTEACVNTVAFAYFNTAMMTSGPGSVLSNVRLRKCRNESCVSYDGDVTPLAPTYNAPVKLLTFGNPTLEPNTFYRVIIEGDVQSTSKAPLTGLNFEGNAFSWTFRTRPDANPCGPQRVAIEPQQTTLRFIGQVGAVTAYPMTSPDKCAVDGQILNSSSFNWDWSRLQTPADPAAFAFLPDVPPGTLINTNPILPAGCSTACVFTGSLPPGTPNCGNGGQLERGEACDTPGTNGCNASCLRTGNAIATGCGDGVVQADRGEECDEIDTSTVPATSRNGQAGSGCTASCLLTGSISEISVCGNGSVGVGEACDDGDAESGDGCGPTCLLEGSDQDVYVCGNGTLEPGEQCDYASGSTVSQILIPGQGAVPLASSDEKNPSMPGFACSDSCLLRGNPVSCPSAAGCCGNGLIEPGKGEGCDSAAENGKPGSGCSSQCIKTGSHPVLRAYCGDTVLTTKLPDTVSGIQNGGGEECEAIALDANIDPMQVVEARNQCSAGNDCKAEAAATVENVTGKGNVTVECSCESDSQCAAFGGNLSCGAGKCCYPRPDDPDINPKGADECRNALVYVVFEDEMDVASLTGNIFVESCGPETTVKAQGSWLARAARTVAEFLRSLIGLEAGAADVCVPFQGAFQHVVDTDATGGKRTLSLFTPSKLFDAEKKHRVTVRGGAAGVKTVKKVGYPEGHNPSQEFTTGKEVCSFDVVEMDPAEELIQTSVQVVTVNATAKTSRGGGLQSIAPVPGAYDWTWSWSLVPEGGGTTPILEVVTSSGPSADVQAKKGDNGKEQVVATAEITADTFFSPTTVGKNKVGKSLMTVLLCENPWPRRSVITGNWAPYVDPETHFEFYYCRDTATSPLPELLPAPIQGQSSLVTGLLRFCGTTRDGDQPKQCLTAADCNAGDACRSKDLFFLFSPEWKLKDALGLRVYGNPDRLSPQEWYQQQRFSGTTQGLAVDGYDALKDGRTVYVGAVDKYGDPELRTYVYVFGYDDRADKRTIEIFDQMVKNLRFNTNLVPSGTVTNICKDADGEQIGSDGEIGNPVTCSSDLDCFARVSAPPAGLHCDSDKDKIRRDLKRWRSLQSIEDALEKIRATTGFYPRLESGSFIRGFTTSKWPSWDQQMGAVAGFKDPLNAYNGCEEFGSECAISRKACTGNSGCDAGIAGDVCRPLFEAGTCFNDRAGLFFCPAASHAYRYRSVGGVDYSMQADFEYVAYPWQGGTCEDQSVQTACEKGIGCRWVDAGGGTGNCETRISTVQSCSGSFTEKECKSTGVSCADDDDCGAEDRCILAMRCLGSGAPCEASADCASDDHCIPAGFPLVGAALGAICGNGLLEGDEACEIGQEQTLTCTTGFRKERCSSGCEWVEIQACPGAAQCGDGSVETAQGESCDDGGQNGQYGRCRSGSLGCVKRCINITRRAPNDFIASRDIKQTCSTNADCADLPFSAVCTDLHAFCGDGRRTGSEACDDGAQNGQYGRCAWDCRGPGPRCGDFEVTGIEQCDGNSDASTGVCVDASDTTTGDASTVPGASASCTRDADCGSGKKCLLCGPNAAGLPQGRTKSCQPATAGETIACTFADWSICKPAGACGNGKVEGAEQCDAGTSNSPSGACLPTCKKNVCNDGFVLTGVEQCDNGTQNGVKCSPKYGLTCNYCKNDCSIEAVSGAFCGDKIIQAPPESCDAGPVSAWCSRTYQNLASPGPNIRGCSDNNDCLPGVCTAYVNEVPPAAECYNVVGKAKPSTELAAGRRGFLASLASHVVSPFKALYAAVAPPRSQGRLAELIPQEDQPYCQFNTDGYCCECPSPYLFDTVSSTCVRSGAPPSSSVGEACHSADDCAATEYCKGGEGECMPYNTQCVPEPYSNTKVQPDSPKYLDGSCVTCSNSCAGSRTPSPFFCGDGIFQPEYGERKVEMIFTVDISGSMQTYIDGISNAIQNFVSKYEGTPHRFGLVVFGQVGNTGTLETNGPEGRVVINLTNVAAFQAAFSDLLADGGGTEPMYNSLHALSDAANPYDIDWSTDSQPYVIVVTDESSPAGGGSASPPWMNEATVAAKVATCSVGGCVGEAGARIETFVIGKTTFKSQWDTILHNEANERFIEIVPTGPASTYYSNKLEQIVFKDICETANTGD